MIRIHKKVPSDIPRDTLDLLRAERPLFFDIETTGLSHDRDYIYLIGCCCPATEPAPENDPCLTNAPPPEAATPSPFITWDLHQWFACGPEDEKQLLMIFRYYVKNFDLVIHFNGDTFDLPFLQARSHHHHVDLAMLHLYYPDLPGLDLLKALRPLKRLLRLPNVKLKTLEQFLGIFREDEYTGGQLVEVYKNYVKNPDPEAERLLLLHNEEDILNMPRVLPLLSYTSLLWDNFRVAEVLSCEVTPAADPADLPEPPGGPETSEGGLISHTSDLTLLLRLDQGVPQSVFFEEGCWKGLFKEDLLRLTCPLYTGELKFFFENYKDYYFLPLENTCMHRSVAEFVDKDHRCRCTRETAFIRHEGTFLPLPGEEFRQERIFRPGYKSLPYVEWGEERDTWFWDKYCRQLCRRLK